MALIPVGVAPPELHRPESVDHDASETVDLLKDQLGGCVERHMLRPAVDSQGLQVVLATFLDNTGIAGRQEFR